MARYALPSINSCRTSRRLRRPIRMGSHPGKLVAQGGSRESWAIPAAADGSGAPGPDFGLERSLPGRYLEKKRPANLGGSSIYESGRPDSNRRRPAWEAGILPLNYAREVRLMREVNVTGPPAGVKRAPWTPPESSGDPARSPPAPPATRCPAAPPASTAPAPRPARTGGRTSRR
jgi:hypothetical protein